MPPAIFTPDIPSLINAIKDFGYLGLLIIVLVTGVRRTWVFGREVEAMQAERDEARKERDRARELLSDMQYQRDEWRIAALYAKGVAARSEGITSHALDTVEKVVADGH